MSEARVNITGRVQGVGFRPFIYRLAVKHGLKGYVKNLGDAGVEVVVEGKRKSIEKFLDEVALDSPQVSEIDEISVKYRPYRARYESFIIDKSQRSKKSASGIFPPDIGICPDCIKDMENRRSRWFEYPFTACSWCGPRLTAVRALPYDRERTHMASFPLCTHCKGEYLDPMDRRFDAQGITCVQCGPQMTLYDSDGTILVNEGIFEETARVLKDGKIVAVKGIGGVHIAALATDDEVVNELRRRKRRRYQPFAVMAPTIDDIKKFGSLTEKERSVISSWRKPIVLIENEPSGLLSEWVAPGLDRVGVMLPYTGIHHMIFKHLDEPALIMTSGNKPGMPMAITNQDAFRELRGIADFFLLHDRDIVNRTDDSVLRMIGDRKVFLRRSRGYAPDPVEVPIKRGFSVAVGAELSNTGAITNDGTCIPTQFLGDIENLESYEYERDTLRNLRRVLNITRNPDVIGCDLHPGYMTSHLAGEMSQETGSPLVTSQHHHAHIASVCAENNVEPGQPVVGIALDGVGYGTDGAVWGGEVLISTYSDFERYGHLEYLPMPGGDLCTKYPMRMIVSALTTVISDEEIRDITRNHMQNGLKHGEKELEIVLNNARNPRVIKTSSSGRFLDSISALTGLCYERTYEGEPAIKLEAAAKRGNPDKIKHDPEITIVNGRYILKTGNALELLTELLNKANRYDIMAFGQKYLAYGIAQMACDVAEDQGVNIVAISGGVLANEYISNYIQRYLENANLTAIYSKEMPPGDGGISLGQSMIALSNVI